MGACKTRSADAPGQTGVRAAGAPTPLPRSAFPCFYLFYDFNARVSLGMDCVERPGRLERSGHTAFIDDNTLFVWGGYQVSAPHLRRCALLARQLPRTVCPLRFLLSPHLQQKPEYSPRPRRFRVALHCSNFIIDY